jgi:hypothetical protein
MVKSPPPFLVIVVIIVVITAYEAIPDQFKVLVLDQTNSGAIYFRIIIFAATLLCFRWVGVDDINTAGEIVLFTLFQILL